MDGLPEGQFVSVEKIENGLLVKFPDVADADKDGNTWEGKTYFVPNWAEANLLIQSRLAELEPKG